MPDGAPITVAAYSVVQEEEFRKRGLEPVEAPKKAPAGRPVKRKKAKER